MKLMIAGGGTGGHVFTGIAVAREWLLRSPQNTVCFVGTRRGLETRLVPQVGFPLYFISISGIKGLGIKGTLVAIFHLPRAFVEALMLLWRHQPDVIFGVGGYASGPIILLAALFRIPTTIIEQNSIPGLANRLLAPWVKRIFLGFEMTRRYFQKDKCITTGNPVRTEVLQEAFVTLRKKSADSASRKMRLFVFGGSQGAERIDESVLEAIPLLRNKAHELEVLHQTGERFRSILKSAYENAGIKAEVVSFIEHMGEAYAWSDLIFCRSGALSVSEIATLGKAAVLIPYLYAADNHQEANARILSTKGAARLLLNHELSGEKMAEIIAEFLTKPEDFLALGREALKFSSYRSARAIADSCQILTRKFKWGVAA